jgi:hypothetical protein
VLCEVGPGCCRRGAYAGERLRAIAFKKARPVWSALTTMPSSTSRGSRRSSARDRQAACRRGVHVQFNYVSGGIKPITQDQPSMDIGRAPGAADASRTHRDRRSGPVGHFLRKRRTSEGLLLDHRSHQGPDHSWQPQHRPGSDRGGVLSTPGRGLGTYRPAKGRFRSRLSLAARPERRQPVFLPRARRSAYSAAQPARGRAWLVFEGRASASRSRIGRSRRNQGGSWRRSRAGGAS